MKNFKHKILMIFMVTVLFSCSEEYEPIKNSIPATSNHLINEEYKYGDIGGKCSIYDVCLSADKQRIGFCGWYGYDSLSTLAVGELAINGEWLWHEKLEINKNTYDIIATENGYLFYGGEKSLEDNYNYFLYYLSPETKSTVRLEMPNPAGKKISTIYHISRLGDNEYLFYLYAEDSYYYAKFRFTANSIQLISSWIASNDYLAICSVIPASDGYDIAGGRIITSQSGDTVYIVARKIHLTASLANVVFNKTVAFIIASSGKLETSMYKDALAVYNGKMYLTYFGNGTSSIICIDYETSNYVWSKAINATPYALITNNNKLYVIGKSNTNDYSSTTVNGTLTAWSAANAYAMIDVLDTYGDALQFYTFGSNRCYSALNNALVNNSQLYLFGYSNEQSVQSDDYFIPSNGFKGWFFKVNAGDL